MKSIQSCSCIELGTIVIKSFLIFSSSSEIAFKKTFPQYSHLCRILYLLFHHHFSPLCTHIHMQRGGLFFLCNSLAYFVHTIAFFHNCFKICAYYIWSLKLLVVILKENQIFPCFGISVFVGLQLMPLETSCLFKISFIVELDKHNKEKCFLICFV